MKKQILIATDGSTYSNQALVYAVRLFGDQPEVTFHLLNCISPTQSPLPEPEDGKNSLFPNSAENVIRHSAADRCLKLAKERLHRLGIAADRITTAVITAGNIALAIQREAEHRIVDCILIARRGIGFVGEMLLGSVSADLFRKCHQTPLWIIDGEITSKNILVYVDGSCHSLMAVDHITHILSGRQDIQIFFYHCRKFFRNKPEKRGALHPKWTEDWCNAYLTGSNAIYDAPCQLLREADIPDYQITILPEKANFDESGSIINQARKHHCGTIVMGRLRAGMARGIWAREVANRTIKNTQDMALWIVG
jgi:nucleotide-binding universal stress UspA family protein